ncbi:hypothetical protein ASG31_06990 [Chryseobacterium sp. Leaf404]|uniref:hypothetical protein n=1 Tax=unclassified Chryseobacterium TaxID=2593645 RepID=UPI0006F40BFC|nr:MULTISPECIES: hypothetical protein [unclassified Chryseobacterium]KQT18460.1 hypothetical protein ASG31_06990 [Chryseobacterium sp. Leaf404]
MENKYKQNQEQNIKIQSTDTLVVLHNNSNTIGIVQNINPDGTINYNEPEQEYLNTILKINSKEASFTQFYSDLYHKL